MYRLKGTAQGIGYTKILILNMCQSIANEVIGYPRIFVDVYLPLDRYI